MKEAARYDAVKRVHQQQEVDRLQREQDRLEEEANALRDQKRAAERAELEKKLAAAEKAAAEEVAAEKATKEKAAADKAKNSLQLKNEGNAHFKAGRMNEAI